MLLNHINNNIIIPNPYNSGVYQDEYEKWDFYQEIDIFLVETKQKTANQNIKTAHDIFERGLGFVGLSISKKGEQWTKKWVFLSVLWPLIVTVLLCISPSADCRLGYHEVWIRSSTLL